MELQPLVLQVGRMQMATYVLKGGAPALRQQAREGLDELGSVYLHSYAFRLGSIRRLSHSGSHSVS